MQKVISIILLVATSFLSIARADDRPSLDPQAIQKLSQPERLAQVLKVLRWRETQLQNFSLQLLETHRNVNTKDGLSTGNESKNEFGVIRAENRIFIHSKRLRIPGETIFESFAATDGAVIRQYSIQSGPGRFFGQISQSQRFAFPYGAYFQFLGLNAQSVPDITLAQWIEMTKDDASQKVTVEVEKEAAQEEIVALKLTAVGSPIEQILWFDPARDGMAVRNIYRAGRDGSWADDRVTESRQENGFWAPIKAFKRSGNGAAPVVETQITSEATRFERGGVKPTDADFKFPPNTTVSDSVRNIRYRIRPDGTELIFPTQDPQTGRYILDGSLPKPTFQSANPRPRSTTQMSQEARDMLERRQMQIEIMRAQRDRSAAQVTPDFIATIHSSLESNPREAVDKFNQQWSDSLQQAKRFDEIEDLAIAASIAVARDTFQLEQLQKTRVRSLQAAGKPKEALAAAKALYNVCGMGSVPDNLNLLAQCLRSANPKDPGIVNRFKLQQLAGAQMDANLRAKALVPLGQPILAGIEIDPKPFAKAIEDRKKGATDFNSLYSLGNLLLLSGRVTEARDAFEKAYAVAPPTEMNYASEGLAKLIKAEDGSVGRANAWALSVRPKE